MKERSDERQSPGQSPIHELYPRIFRDLATDLNAPAAFNPIRTGTASVRGKPIQTPAKYRGTGRLRDALCSGQNGGGCYNL